MKMKAVMFQEGGSAETLHIRDVPMPRVGPGQLLLEVGATAVNRADILQRMGKYPPPKGASPILGLEVAGTVSAIGEGVDGFSRGDRVFGLVSGGGYAQFCLIDADMAMSMPAEWDFGYAAAIPEVFFTAGETLFTLGGLKAGESVLIHAGGSGVGTAGTQMAHAIGAEVFVTAGSWEKIEASKKLGSRAGIHYKTEDFATRIDELTDGKGVHLVQDFIGASYLSRNLQVLRRGGRLVLVGLLGGARTELNLALLLAKQIKIFGSIMRGLPLAEKVEIKQRFEARWLPRLIAQEIRPVIYEAFSYEEVSKAHSLMEENRHFGKIVLRIQA